MGRERRREPDFPPPYKRRLLFPLQVPSLLLSSLFPPHRFAEPKRKRKKKPREKEKNARAFSPSSELGLAKSSFGSRLLVLCLFVLIRKLERDERRIQTGSKNPSLVFSCVITYTVVCPFVAMLGKAYAYYMLCYKDCIAVLHTLSFILTCLFASWSIRGELFKMK